MKKQAFITNFQSEFKRIEWPTRTVLVKSSIITIIMVAFFTLYVYGVDYVLSKVIFGIKS